MISLQELREAFRDMMRNRDELIGINRRNVELVYRNNARRDYPQADDKLLAKELFRKSDVPTPETLAVCDGLYSVQPVAHSLLEHEHFVVKPGKSSGGQGILVVKDQLEPGVWQKAGGGTVDVSMLRHHLAEIVFGVFSKQLEDHAFIERRITPHPLFQELWPDGLCDVRVITLKREPIFSMVRVPTAQSGGKANLHQGGLGLAVDLDTGRTTRAFHRGTTIERHPETGMALVGLELPDWPLLLDVARRAAAAVKLGYLGVDIVVDRERGPLVLEVNARPGLEIQNVHGKGLGPALERVLA